MRGISPSKIRPLHGGHQSTSRRGGVRLGQVGLSVSTRTGEVRWTGAGRGERSHEMTRYLISFPSGAMDHIPDEEGPAVGEAAHAVVKEAMDAGVWVFGGGMAEDGDPVMVGGEGKIKAGTGKKNRELNGRVS